MEGGYGNVFRNSPRQKRGGKMRFYKRAFPKRKYTIGRGGVRKNIRAVFCADIARFFFIHERLRFYCKKQPYRYRKGRGNRRRMNFQSVEPNEVRLKRARNSCPYRLFSLCARSLYAFQLCLPFKSILSEGAHRRAIDLVAAWRCQSKGDEVWKRVFESRSRSF